MTKPTPSYIESYKPQAERIRDLEAEVLKLKSLVADLQESMEDIPVMHEVYKAVRELQNEAQAPAAKWIYYLR